MKTPVVEALFGSGPKAKVITYLYLRDAKEGPLAARALAREANISYGSINKTLAELVKAQLVVREETALGPLYRAPTEDSRLAGLFLVLRQDSQIVSQLKRIFKAIKGIEYAGIFGSFASGKTHRASDIDVLVLETPETDRFSVMTELSKFSEKLRREVNPEFYTAQEFGEKLDRLDPIALSILANPRIDLKGKLPWQI